MNFEKHRITYQSDRQMARSLFDQVTFKHYELLETQAVLATLVDLINEDKDGSYFICKEGKDKVDQALKLVKRIKDGR